MIYYPDYVLGELWDLRSDSTHDNICSWNTTGGWETVNKIKFYRNNLGLSTYKIAELSGLTASYISNLENDNRTNPSKEAMQKIAEALGESVQAIFFPEEVNRWICPLLRQRGSWANHNNSSELDCKGDYYHSEQQ